MKSPNIYQEAEEIINKSQQTVFNDFEKNFKNRQREINFGKKIEKYFQHFFPKCKVIYCIKKEK